jgi:serine/threonine protein kinase
MKRQLPENETKMSTDQVFIGVTYSAENGKASLLSGKHASEIVDGAKTRLKKSVNQICRSSVKNSNVVSLRHSEIELGECLGRGSFASVYEVRSLHCERTRSHLVDRKLVLKVLRPELAESASKLTRSAADLAKEGLFMASLNHDHVLSVRAWSYSGLEGFSSGRHDAFFLIMDRLEETLNDRLSEWQGQNSRLKFSLMHREAKRRDLLQERLGVSLQLAESIRYIHSRKICHRDLKPDNIGFSVGTLKIFDFGVARTIPVAKSANETFNLTMQVGSRRYMSPECGRGHPYNLKTDVYSFSMILHQIISLEKPFGGLSDSEHRGMVFWQGLRPSVPKSWPTVIQTLLRRCWGECICLRPTMDNVCEVLKREIPVILTGKKATREEKPWSPKCRKPSAIQVRSS